MASGRASPPTFPRTFAKRPGEGVAPPRPRSSRRAPGERRLNRIRTGSAASTDRRARAAEALAQLALEQLPRKVLRELVDEVHGFRQLVDGEALARERDELLRGDGALGYDDGGDLDPALVR